MELSVTTSLIIWILIHTAGLVTPREANIYRESRMHPPLITVNPQQEVVFKPGDQIELPCVASGSPQPHYKWMKDGKELDLADAGMSQKSDIGSVTIQAPSSVHEGVYQCLVTNQLGTAVSMKTQLREAELDLFEDGVYKTHRVPKNTHVSLKCSPPSSFPRSVVYWGEYTGLGKLVPLKMSRRVLQDYEGNLWIANVRESDSLQGSNYTCIVKNIVLGTMVHGDEQKVIPISADTSGSGYYEPTLRWSSQESITVVEGSTHNLQCIYSGYPTPNVSWVRSDGDMAEKISEEGYGTELTVPRVEPADQGTYCCRAVNLPDSPPTEKCFNLTVEAMPMWKERPENAETEEGQAIIFSCEATGTPTPSIQWFVNGVPVNELHPDERRVVKDTTISYSNLTTADTQVLQCNASNRHGYIFTNVYLNVAEGPVAERVVNESTAPWIIVILCVAAAVLLAVVLLAIYWAIKRNRNKKHTVLEYDTNTVNSGRDGQEHGGKEYIGLEESLDVSHSRSTNSLVA